MKPAGSPPTLRWTVACYCVVVKQLTKEYMPLLSMLRGCHGAYNFRMMVLTPDKVKAIKLDERNPQQMRQVSTLYYIAALIVENIDFDAIARDDDTMRRSINGITKRPLAKHFFELFLEFSGKVSNQQMPILCLNAVFRSNPQLILDKKAGDWMASMFESSSTDTKSRVLELIHDFLISESKRRLIKGETHGASRANRQDPSRRISRILSVPTTRFTSRSSRHPWFRGQSTMSNKRRCRIPLHYSLRHWTFWPSL